MLRFKEMLKTFAFVGLIFILSSAVNAAAGDVDTSFRPALTVTPDGAVNRTIVQPDGKILFSGYFATVNEAGRNALARLNADGTLDTTFNPPIFGDTSGNLIKSIKLQPDGKIIVGGQFGYANELYSPGVVRLNADGSVDESFHTSSNIFGAVFDVAVLPDGKIIAVGTFTSRDGNKLLKFNADGSLDSSFIQGSSDQLLREVEIQSDGKILLGSASLRRLNTNGSTDPSFTVSTFGSGSVADIKILADGDILVAGDYTAINGFSLKYLTRFNSDGSIDPSFNSGNSGPNLGVNSLELLADGSILIGGIFTTYNSVSKQRSAIIAQDGTTDSSYNPVSVNSLVYTASRQADGKVLIGVSAVSGISTRALHRYNSDGSLDETFQPTIGINQNANRIVFQPDGKILVSGFFAKANGISKRGLARFNPDGTLDNSFNQTVFGSASTVSGLDLQSDGKILASEQGSGKAVRLNSDGSLDVTFSESSNTPDIKALPDGKVLLALNSVLRRYNSNGTFETGFSIGTNGVIRRIELQPDGKILIAGTFTTVAGVSRGNIARLNSDITLDTSFNPPGGANGPVNDIDLLPNGKILIGGSFTGVNFVNRLRVARLNSDGSLDTAFNASPNAEVSVVKGDSNGKVLIGGFFTSVNNQIRRYYSKLNADGSIDLSFNQGYGANHPVFEIVLQQDNKILMGGNFYYVNGFSQAVGLVRLDNSTAVARTRFDFDGDGRADISVFRPSSNVWYQLLGPNYQFSATNFGTSGDKVTPADFDGDGRTDLAIFRPSTGTWWYAASSAGNAFRAVQWGISEDIPLPSDIDGNGRDDFVVYRPSNSTWYRLTDGGVSSTINFGTGGDKPLIGDFDGDGKADPAIYRPSTGTWWYAASSAGNAFRAVQWGISEDIPVAADFDGDGKTDNAVYRPSNGVWYILNSGSGTATVIQFGLSADKPIAADYDGDGKADIAVYRPSTGEWYLLRSSAGFTGLQFGISEDIPIPNSFVP